jgi:hypothetical protein
MARKIEIDISDWFYFEDGDERYYEKTLQARLYKDSLPSYLNVKLTSKAFSAEDQDALGDLKMMRDLIREISRENQEERLSSSALPKDMKDNSLEYRL